MSRDNPPLPQETSNINVSFGNCERENLRPCMSL